MYVQSTASANKVIPLWRFFNSARQIQSATGRNRCNRRWVWGGGQIAGRQPAGEAPSERSSVRVTSWRCSQPIHNSEWPVIRGRKALETILRDQREETEPRWSALPPLVTTSTVVSGAVNLSRMLCMHEGLRETHRILRLYVKWCREISRWKWEC